MTIVEEMRVNLELARSWRKSTYSMNNGNCLEWRKSTYSYGAADCVEARAGIEVRDSKNPDTILTFTPGQWADFIERIRR